MSLKIALEITNATTSPSTELQESPPNPSRVIVRAQLWWNMQKFFVIGSISFKLYNKVEIINQIQNLLKLSLVGRVPGRH